MIKVYYMEISQKPIVQWKIKFKKESSREHRKSNNSIRK
jgi:hypothetical protein